MVCGLIYYNYAFMWRWLIRLDCHFFFILPNHPSILAIRDNFKALFYPPIHSHLDTHQLNHPLIDPLTHPRTHALTHSSTTSLTRSHTHSLTHLACCFFLHPPKPPLHPRHQRQLLSLVPKSSHRGTLLFSTTTSPVEKVKVGGAFERGLVTGEVLE